MLKKIIISIFILIFILTLALSSYLYIHINKLERNYNVFIMQQLLLLEKKDTHGSQSLMSSYIRNALISVDKNNEFSEYKYLCSDWSRLKPIIVKYAQSTIDSKHLSPVENKLIQKQTYDFEQLNKRIKHFCDKGIGVGDNDNSSI